MTTKIKYSTPIPINNRSELAKKNNKRHRTIANAYFNESPSISNIALGVYHYALSDPSLLGENERPYTLAGTAPLVGAAPLLVNKVGQLLPSVAAVIAFLGGLQTNTNPYSMASMARDITLAPSSVSLYDIVKAAEESNSDGSATAAPPIAATDAAASTAATDTTTVTPPVPENNLNDPDENDNSNDTEEKKMTAFDRFIWRRAGRVGKSIDFSKGSDARRVGGNLLRLIGTVNGAEVAADTGYNLLQILFSEPEGTKHNWSFPVTHFGWTPVRKIYKSFGSAEDSIPNKLVVVTESKPQTVSKQLSSLTSNSNSLPVVQPVIINEKTKRDIDSLNNQSIVW